MRTAFAAFLALAATALLAPAAEAHAHLKTAVPEKQAAVKRSPKEIWLTFNESLARASRIELTSKAGKTLATGGREAGKSDRQLVIPLTRNKNIAVGARFTFPCAV
jgi:methionine-rich copper-binding protein CopC